MKEQNKKHDRTKNKSQKIIAHRKVELITVNFLWATGTCWLLVNAHWLCSTLLLDVYGYSSALDRKKVLSSWLKMLLSTLSKEPFCNPMGNAVYTLYLSPSCITNINAVYHEASHRSSILNLEWVTSNWAPGIAAKLISILNISTWPFMEKCTLALWWGLQKCCSICVW